MDFNDSAEEAAFREEAKNWLTANAPTEADLEDMSFMDKCKLWQKRKYDAGWACIRWPKEYGGRGATAIEQVIWNQEEAGYNLPGGVFEICPGSLRVWPAHRFLSGHQAQACQHVCEKHARPIQLLLRHLGVEHG